MDEKKFEQFLAQEKKRLDLEREKHSWRNDPIFQQNERIKEGERLIQEKGLTIGRKVHLRLLNMDGVITEITQSDSAPVQVRRADGEVFGYAPDEVDPIE